MNDDLSALGIAAEEIRETFVRASGPGGQHVNKTATAVQLRFDVFNSPNLPEAVRRRLVAIAGRRISAEGILVIIAQRFRSREQNRKDARERLARMLQLARNPIRRRVPTRPPAAAGKRRLAAKRLRSRIKTARKRPDAGDD